jgi:hypothetical protein
VDRDAVPTFVEVKRASHTRARREAVAQMLDYAANGSLFWAPEQLRAWFEGDDPEGATERLVSWLDPSEEDQENAAEALAASRRVVYEMTTSRSVSIYSNQPSPHQTGHSRPSPTCTRRPAQRTAPQGHRTTSGMIGRLVKTYRCKLALYRRAREPHSTPEFLMIGFTRLLWFNYQCVKRQGCNYCQ